MDLHITREELIRGLGRVQGIIERRTTNPMLSHVLLSARGSSLRMTATDLHHTLIADYPARVEKEGDLSLDAGTLFQVARTLTAATVQLRVGKGNRLQVRSGASEFNIVGTGGEDFPNIPVRDDRSTLGVTGGTLRRAIEETLFSISLDENRYGLNGAHLEEVTGPDGQPRLRIVTTDGSRLSYSEVVYKGQLGMGRKVLLPRKALAEVKKLIDHDDADWQITFGERSAAFTSGGLSLMVRLVEGEFPDYRQVLPAVHKRRVTVDRESFGGALKRALIMASDRNHSVRFAFEESQLVLSAQNLEAGDVREVVPADLEGAPLFTGFNVKYFQDILTATRGDKLQIELGEALDPCIVRLPERDDCLFVVMPMRLD